MSDTTETATVEVAAPAEAATVEAAAPAQGNRVLIIIGSVVLGILTFLSVTLLFVAASLNVVGVDLFAKIMQIYAPYLMLASALVFSVAGSAWHDVVQYQPGRFGSKGPKELLGLPRSLMGWLAVVLALIVAWPVIEAAFTWIGVGIPGIPFLFDSVLTYAWAALGVFATLWALIWNRERSITLYLSAAVYITLALLMAVDVGTL